MFSEVTPLFFLLMSSICGNLSYSTETGTRLDLCQTRPNFAFAGPWQWARAPRVRTRVNLESGAALPPQLACVIHARNSSFLRTDPRDGERERQKSDVGSNNIFAFFLASRSWDVTFHGQYMQLKCIFHLKQKAQVYSIQVFISSRHGSQVSSDPYLHLNSE